MNTQTAKMVANTDAVLTLDTAAFLGQDMNCFVEVECQVTGAILSGRVTLIGDDAYLYTSARPGQPYRLNSDLTRVLAVGIAPRPTVHVNSYDTAE